MQDFRAIVTSIDNVDELVRIIQVILEKSGIEIESIFGNAIRCSLNIAVLGKQRQLFYIVTEHLGGEQSGSEIITSIQEMLRKDAFNSVIIVSSKHITSGFRDRMNDSFRSQSISFWGRDELIERIHGVYSDFWRHSDQELLAYEKEFSSKLEEDWGIKKIKQFKSAHTKLLEIFIEPRLMKKVVDKESPNKAYERTSIEHLKKLKQVVILEGEPGAGKTRLLKQIGISFISDNSRESVKQNLPVFINNIDLLETRNGGSNSVSLTKALNDILEKYFPGQTTRNLAAKYNVVCLIDSLDDFGEDAQKQITSELGELCTLGIKVIFGTRFQDFSTIHGVANIGKFEEVYVEKFNEHQIRHFLERYFQSDKSKADNLLESLKENYIIQRLPITPLTLSLISILYEENNFEIPATITDVYDNFNNLLLGRSIPETRFDFFDITIRERILSAYAYELLKRGQRNYMTLSEFNDYFRDFFRPVSGTINLDLLPEALNFIINNTGILILQDGRYVKFLHESYLEYYASREIFYYNRVKGERELVDNFLDINWQFTTIFYAGRIKQMPDFLRNVIERTKQSRKVPDLYKSVSGLGYLIQALYLTDDNIRKEAITSSLSYVVEVYEWMKKLSADEAFFFKNLSMPVTALISTMFFFDYHNSVTIRRPLEMAYQELKQTLDIQHTDGNASINPDVAYKLFTIAMTLSSPRLNSLEQINDLIFNTSILNDPIFETLLTTGIAIAGNKELYELKGEVRKLSKGRAAKPAISIRTNNSQLFLTAPAGRYRNSIYDRIQPIREVQIITEGKTDSQIIEHAFTILTDSLPYWNIEAIHDEQGGANELAKCLANGGKLIKDKRIVIGLFDNDAKGIQEFNGSLTKSKFSSFAESKRLKKHFESEIYGLKLPVPPTKQYYLQDDQAFNFFSIEHYFSIEFLKEHDIVQVTPIPDVYRIKDGAGQKNAFSKAVRKITNPEIFKDFVFLFKEIDFICGMESVEYNA